jgi:Cof subfamily protein (haloacid dehalogenase superfamily)
MHPPVRLVAIDMDGTLLPSAAQSMSERNARALRAAQSAGITVVIATGRRMAYTVPLMEGLGLRADTPLITSNGAVLKTLDGQPIDRCHMDAVVARGLCGLLRPFGVLVFTFDRPGRGELVLEDLERVHGRIALWVEANRNAIQVFKPLELAFNDGEDPIQGMVAGEISRMREAEQVLKASEWCDRCESARTEYPARDLSILDLLPRGVSKGWALEQLAGRLGVSRSETMAIGDNWNDVDMLEWAAQGVIMGNAAGELRAMAKSRGWKQAPPNDEDGVAVVLEDALKKLATLSD